MGKIQVTKDKKTSQIKYLHILDKKQMDDLVIQQGDDLILKSIVGNEITFKLKRKSE